MNPATLMPLWDVMDGTVVDTYGAQWGVCEVEGLDATTTLDAAWELAAEAIETGLRRLRDGAQVQFIHEHGTVDDASLRRILRVEDSTSDGDLERTLRYQRQRRYEFLRRRQLRQRRSYIVFGSRGLSWGEFRHVDDKTHQEQAEELERIGRQVVNATRRAGIRLRRLDTDEVLILFRRWLGPNKKTKPSAVRRETPLASAYEDELRRMPQLRPRSIREQLYPGNGEWNADWVRLGETYFKVLAAKELPLRTSIGVLDRPNEAASGAEEPPLPDVGFDYRIVVHLQFPSNQKKTKKSFGRRKNFAKSAEGESGGGSAQEQDAEAVSRDLDALYHELTHGEKLVRLGLQVVVWGDCVAEVDRRARVMTDELERLNIVVFEESWAHDRELPKSLPGMGAKWDRWRLVPCGVAADFVPVATQHRGDEQPVLTFEHSATREMFGWTPRARARANDNFVILGAPGAGKSVFINMLLAYGALSGPTKGRILAIDYAGPVKSSFRVAAEIFGGQYISVQEGGATINPFPSPAVACPEDGTTICASQLRYLQTLTDLLLHNTDDDKDAALHSRITQWALKRLYERWGRTEAPIFSDFLVALEAYEPGDVEEQARHRHLVSLTHKMLEGPESRLLNARTTATMEGDFLVYDLYGLKGFGERVRSAVAFLVTQNARNMAFDGRPDILKYIFFEEATQLLQLGMASTLEELLKTGRAHAVSVGTITQEYLDYRRSGLHATVSLCSTTEILMSHEGSVAAIDPIVEDFHLNAREAGVFRSLRGVKGEYSEMLVRTTSGEGSDARKVAAKVALKLSPFDYQVVTSDAKDRAKKLAVQRALPTASQVELLDFLAYGRQAS